MSDFFSIFNPGLRYWQEQRDLDKVLVVTDEAGGTGPKPLDLDSGKVTLVVPAKPGSDEPDGTTNPGAP